MIRVAQRTASRCKGSLFRIEQSFAVSCSAHPQQHALYKNASKAARIMHRNECLRHRSSGSSPEKPGLFSINGLHRPQDFICLAKEAMNRCDAIRRSLANSCDEEHDIATETQKLNKARRTLEELDAVSNEVCSVIDAAELCRSVHSSEEWRTSASNAFQMLSSYIADLNSDDGLYGALRRHVTDCPTTFAALSEEEQRMATLLRAEFERDGIHLPLHEREQVKHMQNNITQLESDFSSNIITRRKFFPLPAPEVSKIIPSHILHSIVPQALQHQQPHTLPHHNNGNPQSPPQDTVTVSSDGQIVNTLLKYSQNPSLRQEVYMQANTACPENLTVLEDLVRCRHELAIHLGFASYADRYLRDKMAKDQATVYSFLHQMHEKVKHAAYQEMQMILHAKRRLGEHDASTVYPWDVPFYSGLIKSQLHDFDTSTLAPYLTMENCLDGIRTICQSLFGVRMDRVPLQQGEGWCDNMQKLHLTQEGGEEEAHIGTIYLDLHPRPGKYLHAAHFTIQCGCQVREKNGGGKMDHDDGTPVYQPPVVALVCNLSAPLDNTTAGEKDGARQSNLSHSEVETLFHEVGHALHSLLSRTKFQHLSGTRSAVDFVETPSHFMEYFIYDPTVLKTFAVHGATGKVVPDDLVQKLAASRDSFRNLEILNQVLYARFDQELFGLPPSGKGGGGVSSSSDLFARLHREFQLPFAEGTHWHSRFGHLVTYGAGYYGYLYDQVFAADLWSTCFAKDPLNATAGRKLRKEILVHGGAKDPHAMLRGMLGREPTVDAFFQGVLKDAK